MHVPLRNHRGDGVEQLIHPGHAQSRHIEHLGLTPLEERRTVRGGQKIDFGRQWADL